MLDVLVDAHWWVTIAWQTFVLLGVALGVSLVLDRHPARAHAALAAGFVSALLAPMLTLLLRWAGMGFLPAHASADAVVSIEGTPAPAVAGVVPGSLEIGPVLLIAWIAVTALMSVRLIVSMVRGNLLVLRWCDRAEREMQLVLFDAADAIDLARRPVAMVCPCIRSPMIWCWSRRPRVLLPVDAPALEREESLRAVCCHELAHLHRRDHVWALVSDVVCCCVPWNPLAWMGRARLRALAERACDTWAVEAGPSRATYLEALVGLLPQRAPGLVLASASSAGALKSRIRRLGEGRAVPARAGRAFRGVVVGVGVLLVAGVGLANRRGAPAPVENERAGMILDAWRDEVQRTEDAERAGLPIRLVPGEIDYGELLPGARKVAVAMLVNTGEEPVDVRGMKVACGCTKVKGFQSGALAPGESLQMEITMTAPEEPGASVTKAIHFKIEGQALLELSLKVRSRGASAAR